MEEIKIRVKIEDLSELTEAIRALVTAKGGQLPAAQESQQALPSSAQTPPATSYPSAPQAPVQQQGAVPTAPVAYGQPIAPVQAAPAVYSQPPAPAASAGMGAQMPGSSTAPVSGLPTTAVSQEYTIEQLQVAAAGLSSMGRMPQLMGILQQFGIQAMTELPRERYGEFAMALREAGAQV